LNKKIFTLITLLLVIFLSSPLFAKLVVISPEDKSITKKSGIVICGAEDSTDKDEVAITIKGKVDGVAEEFTEVASMYDREFSIEVDLYPGKNTVIIGNKPVNVFYDTGDLTPPADYKEINYHSVALSGCSDCHDNTRKGLPLSGKVKEICLGCHPQNMKIVMVRVKTKSGKIKKKKKEIRYKNLHKPVFEGKCLECHMPHSSPNKGLLREENVFTLCEKCHKRVFDALSISEGPHPPQKDGECVRCHSPHASEEKFLFKKSLKFTCFECHDSFLKDEKGKEKKIIHKMTKGGACYECHDLHFKEMKTKFLISSKKETCIKCHNTKTADKHAKVDGSCGACHSSHSSDYSALLKAAELDACSSCHKDVSAGENIHPALEDGCSDCHGSLHAPNKMEDVRKICYDCHDSGEVKGVHKDLDIKINKCLFCHNPHSSNGEKLLGKEKHPPFEDGECDSCHEQTDEGLKLAEAPPDLCFQCHDASDIFVEGLKIDDAHTPVADGECPECHSPHATDNEKFVYAPGGKLCLKCHDYMIYKEGNKPFNTMHPPAEDLECLECHNPHGSTVGSNLNEKVETLCFNCHDDFAEDKGDDAFLHPPYEDRECTECHNPHGTDDDFLIKENQIKVCAQCHDNKTQDDDGNTYKTIHPPVKAGTCSKCHDPHVADHEIQLRRKGNKLCRMCHEKLVNHHPLKYQSNNASISIEKGFRRDGDNFACVGCHNPHATNNVRMFHLPKKKTCKRCHTLSGD
jgi:predicted CXXCH cytochrome family protein